MKTISLFATKIFELGRGACTDLTELICRTLAMKFSLITVEYRKGSWPLILPYPAIWVCLCTLTYNLPLFFNFLRPAFLPIDDKNMTKQQKWIISCAKTISCRPWVAGSELIPIRAYQYIYINYMLQTIHILSGAPLISCSKGW
jgi:hypothetical protein